MSRSKTSVLKGRYTLQQKLQVDVHSETWIGTDSDDESCLVKLWPFQSEKPDDPARAYWNSELRVIWRVCSSPKAGNSILRIRDAGIDFDTHEFVMVLKSGGGGYCPLSHALRHQSRYETLSFKNLRRSSYRAEIWAALFRLAEGIDLLHSQHVIHRNVCAESVFIDVATSAESWRLGGFEWSLRVGAHGGKVDDARSWVIPPETRHGVRVYAFESDWYAFGLLAARIFCSLEHSAENGPDALAEAARSDLSSAGESRLEPSERDFLLDLIRAAPDERLIYGQEIVSICKRIAETLATGAIEDRTDLPLVLAFRLDNAALISAAVEAGFTPEDGNSAATFSRLSFDHVEALKRFLRQDLQNSRLFSLPGKQTCVLLGHRLSFLISRYIEPGSLESTGSWEVAFLVKPTDLFGARIESCRDLGDVPILPLPIRDAIRVRQRQSWDRFVLQARETESDLTSEQQRLHDFLRATNQLELLMCAAKIFGYQIYGERIVEPDGNEIVRIVEDVGTETLPSYAKVKGGLVALLLEDLKAEKPYFGEVILTHSNTFRLEPGLEEFAWRVQGIPQPGVPIILRRRTRIGAPVPPTRGFVRTRGLWGQLRLIERRQSAIDRLEQHAFLLGSLASPGDVCMDTHAVTTAYRLRSEDVDESKRAVIEDTERVRPIYALQGPPGTGKTHQVAFLLRRVFADDPMVQVLVTAQAKGAVNVLRDRVRKAFASGEAVEAPLGVRLGGKMDRETSNDQDSVPVVTHRLLERTQATLASIAQPTTRQQQWSTIVNGMLHSAEDSFFARCLADFQQLVKRSAGITYCTTSAGDLAALAEGSEDFDWTFDWSIVEEAGKAHGFDLALPLQAGHRWLLLGDQKQLEPFQLESFELAVGDLEGAIAALERLPGASFVDKEWFRRWRELTVNEQQDFKKFARTWLKTFDVLFGKLARVFGTDLVTGSKACGAFAGRLRYQWRMHPTIGKLISDVFYGGDVVDSLGTVDDAGRPTPEVCHGFYLPDIPSKFGIAGRSIVWIDVPWCQSEPEWAELGEQQQKLNYSNPKEATVVRDFVQRLRPVDENAVPEAIAILSPYTQQVFQLSNELSRIPIPRHLKLVASLGASDQAGSGRWTHTVDSFQGNEAAIVIVSLVRNNARPPGKGLGFVAEPTRTNVMLSRAEHLLVLVGSWVFFREQTKYATTKDEKLWHWKEILDKLEGWFDSGEAVRIPSRLLQKDKE